MKETLTDHQKQIIKSFCEKNDITIIKTYSGRGMFNSFCFGLSVNDGRSATTLLAQLIEAGADECSTMDTDLGVVLFETREFINLFATHQLLQDNLGKGMIYYFPTLQWGDLNPDEMESEEDSPEE